MYHGLMAHSPDDNWDLAAARVLARLSEDEGIEFVSSRGVPSLTSPLAAFLLRLSESGETDRADALADWLMEQQEVADLYASDSELEALLHEEWDPLVQRVDRAASGKKKDVRNARNDELEQLLSQDPDNVELYLVYGDWLQEQGDPLGELMARQAVLAVDPTQENQTAAEEHLRRYQDYFLGRLIEAAKAVQLEWHMGFIRAVRLGLPAGSRDEYQGAILLDWLLALPTARFLRDLWLGPFDHRGADQYAEMMQVLLAAERPTMRDLYIGPAEDTRAASWSDAGNLSGLATGLPELRRLEVHTGHVTFDELELPWIEELVLQIENLTPANVAALAGSRLPFLERLELRSPGYTLGEDPQPLSRLLSGEGMPVLEALSLGLSSVTGVLLELLVESPLLAQIEELDLSEAGLTDAGAALIAKHGERFSHLARLDLSRNRLGQEGIALVQGVCPEVLVDEQHSREPDDEHYNETME